MAIFDKFKLLAARLRKAPKRDTQVYSSLIGLGVAAQQQNILKPIPANLRYFSRTPHARRAINFIKNIVSQLGWDITPNNGVKINRALVKQIDSVRNCFSHPNNDDNFQALLEKTLEDYLVFGAGVIEQQLSNDPNRPIWFWPVDAKSISPYIAWSGNEDEARYCQNLGYDYSYSQGKDLRNDEIIYIKCNSSNDTPYGYGPLEIAFNTINRLLGTAHYAGNVATNAQPATLMYVGDATPGELQTFRGYWQNEIEGQGKIPFVGGKDAPKAVNLRPQNDEALYLKYQTFLIREIATAFNISPQNLGIEADVNRNTSEVSADRDWDSVIKPLANVISSALTREAIQSRLGFYQLQFKFVGLDREDEEATAKIFDVYYKSNCITPNEQRARLGVPPLENEWANLTYADTQIAIAAARSAQVIEDSNFPKQDNLRPQDDVEI